MTSHQHDGQIESLGERASRAIDAEVGQDADDIANRIAGERFAKLMDGLRPR